MTYRHTLSRFHQALLIALIFVPSVAFAAKPADFTGDGTSDLALWNPSDGVWYVKTTESASPSQACPPCFTYHGFGGCSAQWGLPGDTPRPADFDNDNKVDMAVWRPTTKTWWIRLSNPLYGSGGACGVAQIVLPSTANDPNLGIASTDRPDAADVTGDGYADVMMFRKSPNAPKWFLRNSATGVISSFSAFNTFTTDPFETPFATVSADYILNDTLQSTVRAEGARFENKQGLKIWSVTQFERYPGNGLDAYALTTRNQIAPADPDEVATRGQWGGPTNYWDYSRFHKNGAWTIQYTQFGSATVIPFGLLGDKPLSGDYNGDSISEPAVWRPSEARFYINISGVCPSGMTHDGAPSNVCWTQWGLPLMIPIESLADMSINYQ